MSRDSNPSSTAGYAQEADRLAVQYESITFEDVHRDVLHLIPTGLTQVFTGSRGDRLGRGTVRWTLLAFRKQPG